jgi:hypothetical protein
MFSHEATGPTPAPDSREGRVEALLARLRGDAEATLRRMAERLVDLPEDLRDLAHGLASSAHQAGLDAGKKRATEAPASPAPAAKPTPASSAIAARPG